ncbi:PAS domain-containing protein [Archaeoglobus sp.]
MNYKSCRILGYSKKEIVGRSWFDEFIPERINEDARMNCSIS